MPLTGHAPRVHFAAVKLFAKWFKRTSAAEKQLMKRCMGDVAQVERLIAYEQQRRPGLSRAAASDAAVDRWKRDR